jgi:hypothetical protein
MAYTLDDLETCERQIATLQTMARNGDVSVQFGALPDQIKVRDLIRAALVAQGETLPDLPVPGTRARAWTISLSKGL